jgi:hypothetical protein
MSETIKFQSAEALLSGDLKNAIVPIGYININLSTKGKISQAPASIMARAMTAAEVLSLSIYIKDELQGPLINLLDSLIYRTGDNNTPSVANWTPEEVIEFTIKYYTNFFGVKMSEIDYKASDDELIELKKQKRDTEITSLEQGKWKPKVELDLSKLNFLKLPEDVSNKLVVTGKKDKFSVTFRFPYYGDILVVNKALTDLTGKEGYPEPEVLLALLSNAVLVTEVQGTSIESFTLADKLELLMNDPKFSISLFEAINQRIDEIRFGVDENIPIISPITGKPTTRRFLFRVLDVLSAITVFQSDGYDVRFK